VSIGKKTRKRAKKKNYHHDAETGHKDHGVTEESNYLLTLWRLVVAIEKLIFVSSRETRRRKK
jgi:hypothetical protein